MQNCRNEQEEDDQSVRTQTTTVPSSSSSAATARTARTKAATKPTVRQIAMYRMGDKPDNFPEVFELDEDEEEIEIEYFGRILRVTDTEEFCLSSGEESETEPEERDPLLDWYLGREPLQAQEVLTVQSSRRRVFPGKRSSRKDRGYPGLWCRCFSCAVLARKRRNSSQGKAIKTEGRRMLNLTFFGEQGSFCRIQEAFAVASVINPPTAIGKLFREGWKLRVAEPEGMCLTDGSSRIPVHLHKNSLAAYAYVQTPSRSRENSVCYDMVRTVVQLIKHLQEAANREEPGWHNTDSMVIVKHANQSSYENPSLMYSVTHFPYRSTLVKEDRGWRAVEVWRKYIEKADPFEEFAEGEKEVVTAISAKPIPLWILGTPYDAGDRADQESHGRDHWKVDLEKGEVVRHHVVPRTVLFNPTGVSNCPVLFGDLENGRQTQGECIYSTELYEHNDDWRADRLPLREHFRLPWLGQTRFRIKPEVLEDMRTGPVAEEARRQSGGGRREDEERSQQKKEEDNEDEEMSEAPEAPEDLKIFQKLLKYEKKAFTTKVLSTQQRRAVLKNYKHFAESTE